MTEVGPEGARAIAAEAFVFGYPLMLMDATRAVMTHVARPAGMKAPVNQICHLRAFPDASFTDVVSPNADTLYSLSWLDLAAEPMVLRHADAGDRFFLLPLYSGWTDVIASPGTRTTGGDAAAFAITGPGWSGTLPEGASEIRSPTEMVWLIGRTQTNGKADYEAVHRFQDGITMTPLSAWGRDFSPPGEVPVDPGVDPATPPADAVAGMGALAFFARLAALMVANPPAEGDGPAMERFAAIGLAPGEFAPPRGLVSEIAAGHAAGLAALADAERHAAAPTDGWTLHRGLGAYGTDYGKRAAVAQFGLGANLDEDAIYPRAALDAEGRPLHGEHRYVLRFARGRTPPARAFWSLTMYDERQAFVDNPIDRYAIGDRDPLTPGDDGSLEILIQRESPGAGREGNWLPAPAGSFNVVLRVYWPAEAMLDGTWTPPGIARL
jgi:hypothetical protein